MRGPANGSSHTGKTGQIVIRMFGALSIEDGMRTLGPRDLGGMRPKQVLEILLAARGHRVPTDRLAELVWPGDKPQNRNGSLQTFVSVLRRKLTTDREQARALVVTEPEAYRFAPELVTLDLDRFDELLERSAREPTRLARRSLEEALALVRGEVLEDEPYSLWAQDLRGSYQGRVLGAHLDAADAALAERNLADALAHCESAVALDRFSERAQRLAMLALYALGRQHDALARYRSFRAALDEDLGLEPTPETRMVETAILRQADVDDLLPRPITGSAAHVASTSMRLLGRKREREALEAAARRALDGGFALVQIEGDAGLGKTRMLDEIATFFAGARVGRAHSCPLEQHLPYTSLAAALRDARLEFDREQIPALGLILPELALGRPEREFADLEALEALVQVITENAPVVLMFDDAHTADPETVAALDYLQVRCAGIPGALVVTVRTARAPSDHPIRGLAPTTIVHLCPLTADELAPLGKPGLHEATGGNPRFVTDALAGDGKPLELSTSLADTLLAQLRAEGPEVYRMLRTASLLEQPFDPEPLARLLGGVDTAELTEELERLCELRILRVDGLGFRFRYDLVRQVLRRTVSPARRRLMVRRLGTRVADAMPSPIASGPLPHHEA
jgi:DNA-binding SARP family transcriptional activator